MVTVIKNTLEYNAALSKHAQIMLKFSATWCGPCKAVKPVVEKLEPMFPQVYFGEVDVDENQDVAQMFNVTAMPTFVFLNNGVEVDRIKGGDIPKITSALRNLQSHAKTTFGNSGVRLGSSNSNVDIREARLRAIAGEKPKVVDQKVNEKVELKPQVKSGEPIYMTFVKIILLYFVSLFTLDSRGSANAFLAKFK